MTWMVGTPEKNIRALHDVLRDRKAIELGIIFPTYQRCFFFKISGDLVQSYKL